MLNNIKMDNSPILNYDVIYVYVVSSIWFIAFFHIKIILGDFNAKVGRENTFHPR